VRSDPDRREKELLRALERHEEITAARAAMETSLSIAQAEEMLAKLVSGGHVEVRARAGTLAYALHEADRRDAGPKELAQAEHEPIE
jgi:predicted ArsR family transcriptional regulator